MYSMPDRNSDCYREGETDARRGLHYDYDRYDTYGSECQQDYAAGYDTQERRERDERYEREERENRQEQQRAHERHQQQQMEEQEYYDYMSQQDEPQPEQIQAES